MVERKMSATPAEWEVLEVLFRRAPLSAREVYDEGRGFLQRFFSGRAELGAAYFIENGDVSREELERLRALLERKLNGEEAE